MERRSFLKGLLAGVSAASSTALVKLASPEEVAMVKEMEHDDPQIYLGRPQASMPNAGWIENPTVYMLNADNRFEEVGILREIRVESFPMEYVSWTGEIGFHQGLRRVYGTFTRDGR